MSKKFRQPARAKRNVKKIKSSPFTKHKELEKELLRWFTLLRSKGVQILAATIKAKALEIAKDLKLVDLKLKKNWWERFKSRMHYLFERLMHLV